MKDYLETGLMVASIVGVVTWTYMLCDLTLAATRYLKFKTQPSNTTVIFKSGGDK